ncbi:AAA family ATPase [Mesorhizobium sp. ISC25]|uniref:AAA family ATPase n=1 Tax=Mesorhizobium sp. ISC25 TaxID=3077335 RepID=UPI0035DA68B7
MREAEYRKWLEAGNYSANTVNTQITQARRLDQAYGDLDAVFVRDGFAELRRTLAYSRQDKRDERPNPASFPIAGDLYANLASYRASLSYYGRFAGGGETLPSPDRHALDALKQRFLSAFPDFEAGGGFTGSTSYHREEDDYKRTLVARANELLHVDPPPGDAELGGAVLDALSKDSNLLGYYRSNARLSAIRSAHPGALETAAGALFRASDPPPVAADSFLATAWPLLREGSEESLPYGDTRILATVIQALARPEIAISVIYQRFHNFGMAMLDRPLFGNNVLTASEYETVLQLAAFVFTVMDVEWAWHPRDLWDVQGFVWVTCKEKLGDEQMGPAIDRGTVEMVMNECDALGEASFVAKYNRSLRGVRYRVVRGNSRYPSKAIANAAYETMHGEPGPYGGSEARRVLAALGYEIVAGEDGAGVEDERSPAEARAVAVEPTNLILYGPPGTGKTYETAVHAVRLCLNLMPYDPMLAATARAQLMVEYKRLVAARRIQFVTFHQSYSYEEFVEGLRPETGAGDGEDGMSAGFRLVAKRGVFREISALAEQARKSAGQTGGFDVSGRQVFKMSLGRAGLEDHIFEAAVEGNYVALGWGGKEDWSDARYEGDRGYQAIFDRWNEIEPGTTGNSGHISQLWRFRTSMREGDLVVISNGNSEFRAIGEVTGAYHYEASDDNNQYHHRRAVRWLLLPDEPLPADTIYDKPFTMRSCYLLQEQFLKRDALAGLLPGGEGGDQPADAYVLVIDEINRANISKVFGELITLIEPDKRIDAAGEIKVRLPYSREMFGIPPNLHLVGTMNTADRSIALLDTALRRRFDFVELMPDADRLESEVNGVPLRRLLETINARIEYLFDREHQIGHGFFMQCRNRSDIDRVMRRKILPLLQEYFFEDWEKVAHVLGDADAKAGEGAFLTWQPLKAPEGFDGGAGGGLERRRWSVRADFPLNAYTRIVG